jgi:hypothetical protein
MEKLLWTSKSNAQNVFSNTGNLFPTTFKSGDLSPSNGAGFTGFPAATLSPESVSQSSHTAKAPVVPDQSAAEDFEGMVGDLRRIFIGWLKKTELELAREKALLEKAKADFDEEKAKSRAAIEEDRRKDSERIREERKRNDLEVQTQLRQVQVEREEARKRLDEEKTKRRSEWEEENRRLLVEKEKFRQQQEAFAHEKKRITDHNAATEVMVELNVGGTPFQTARTTLCQQQDSFLAGMASGRHSVDRDKNGRIFIDRDSEQFRSILNFLRNPTKPPAPRDSTESELLAAEANFYGVHFFPFPLVFAVGGHNGIEHLRAVEVLDAVNETWRACRGMATERVYFGGATLNSRLFVFGGQNLDYKALCETEIYDCLRDEWLLGPELNIARRNCAGTSIDGRVYAIGGFDGTGLLSSVEAYDPRMKNWAEVAPLKTARSSASAGSVGGKIFVVGGSCGQRLNTVEVYEPKMNKWNVLSSPMTEARSAGACAALLNRVYAIGGTDNDQQIHSSVEMFDEGLWTYRSACQSARMDLSACTVAESSILAGGGQSVGGAVLNQTEFFFPELNQWQAAPAMLIPRYGHVHLSVSL